jgi:hypothetical protein
MFRVHLVYVKKSSKNNKNGWERIYVGIKITVKWSRGHVGLKKRINEVKCETPVRFEGSEFITHIMERCRLRRSQLFPYVFPRTEGGRERGQMLLSVKMLSRVS